MSGIVRSMTGFARVSGTAADGTNYTLSLKSVNHRFLDLQFRMPGGLDALELGLRKLLKERVVRGHVDVTLQVERAQRTATQYDRTLMKAYVDAFRQAAEDFDVTGGEPDLNHALRLQGMLSGEAEPEKNPEVLETAVMKDAETVIEALNVMRAREGDALRAELHASMDGLEKYVGEVEPLRSDVQRAYFERLKTRMEEMLAASGAGANVDQQRILQEAAVQAERSDIEEELVRLRAHIAHFRELMDAGGEVGKKLDFLLQELNREANTLLSKTSGAAAGNGLRITEAGLGIKSVIEKAREQVQNLE